MFFMISRAEEWSKQHTLSRVSLRAQNRAETCSARQPWTTLYILEFVVQLDQQSRLQQPEIYTQSSR